MKQAENWNDIGLNTVTGFHTQFKKTRLRPKPHKVWFKLKDIEKLKKWTIEKKGMKPCS